MTLQPDTEVDLDALHDQIVARLAAALPGVTVDMYPVERRQVPTPGCYVTAVDMEAEPDHDPGTGQLAMLARYEAHVIVGLRTARARHEAQKLAARVALAIHSQRWGQPIGPAMVALAEPDEFAPELDQYEVWRVDWAHRIHVGPSIWDDAGTTPGQVWLGWAPKVGPGREPDYVPASDEAWS